MEPAIVGYTEPPKRADLRIDLLGEGLLLSGLVIAPWIYGSVEDTARYLLCAVVLVAGGFLVWPDIREKRVARGLAWALALPGFVLVQLLLQQSVAPILSIEAAMVGFSMAMAWAAIDSRAGSASTNTSRRLALALLVVCACESAFAAFQWSVDRRALFGQRSDFQTMPFGSYVNHNNFAGLVSMGVPLAIAMAIGDLRRSGTLTPGGLGLTGLALGLTIAVLASGSRGGAMALVFGLGVLAWIAGLLRGAPRAEPRSYSRLAPLGLGAALVIVAALAIPAATRDRLTNVLTQGSDLDKGDSVNYRVDLAWTSFRTFMHNPLLGSGLGAFGDAAAPFKLGHGDVRSERAEGDLLEFAVEGGLVFIAGLLWFGTFAWTSARGEMTRGRGRSGKWLRAGAFASCVTMMFHSFFDFGFRIPANALAFAVLLGIATATSEPPAGRNVVKARLLTGALVLLALGCGYRSLGAAGERAALARTSPESRLDALEPLVNAHPYLDRARRQRGLAWMALAYSQGRYDPVRLQRARADLEAVLKLRPQWAEARADLGWVAYYEGKTDEAKSEMLRASRDDPTHMGVGLAYAQVLAWTGETEAAIGELGRLRTLNPAWSRVRALELASSWTQNPSLLDNIP